MTAPVPTAERSIYGVAPDRRVTVVDVARAKAAGERWAMLTAYDVLTAGVFDEAGVPVLLVGDSAANVVYGYSSTIPVTVEELRPLARAVVRGTRRAMVVADLPFGSYQEGPTQALRTATKFLKDGVHAVKLEGGARVAPQVEALVGAGVPVVGHVGLTPQSVHALGGYRVQGRDGAGEALLTDVKALEAAGAFAVVLELVPADLAGRVTAATSMATIGIGAGTGCDAQVLVWQDMAGLTDGPGPRFVKRYADVRSVLAGAAREFVADVREGAYPAPEHSYS